MMDSWEIYEFLKQLQNFPEQLLLHRIYYYVQIIYNRLWTIKFLLTIKWKFLNLCFIIKRNLFMLNKMFVYFKIKQEKR